MIDCKTKSVRRLYVVRTGQAGESLQLTTVGFVCPLVASVRHCNQGRKGGNEIPTGQEKRKDGGNGANLRSHVLAVSLPPATRHDVIAS